MRKKLSSWRMAAAKSLGKVGPRAVNISGMTLTEEGDLGIHSFCVD
jgi:hypothetical protein